MKGKLVQTAGQEQNQGDKWGGEFRSLAERWWGLRFWQERWEDGVEFERNLEEGTEARKVLSWLRAQIPGLWPAVANFLSVDGLLLMFTSPGEYDRWHQGGVPWVLTTAFGTCSPSCSNSTICRLRSLSVLAVRPRGTTAKWNQLEPQPPIPAQSVHVPHSFLKVSRFQRTVGNLLNPGERKKVPGDEAICFSARYLRAHVRYLWWEFLWHFGLLLGTGQWRKLMFPLIGSSSGLCRWYGNPDIYGNERKRPWTPLKFNICLLLLSSSKKPWAVVCVYVVFMCVWVHACNMNGDGDRVWEAAIWGAFLEYSCWESDSELGAICWVSTMPGLSRGTSICIIFFWSYVTQWNRKHHPHFTGEETKAQRMHQVAFCARLRHCSRLVLPWCCVCSAVFCARLPVLEAPTISVFRVTLTLHLAHRRCSLHSYSRLFVEV